MTFSLPDHWVWDFWTVDDGSLFHLYYLHAPVSLGDPQLRHRNARIGHAISTDLRTWVDQGPVIGPGQAGLPDETATWTGSVVRAPGGDWRMFYTGSRFLAPNQVTNIESVVTAVSRDLHDWTTVPGVVVEPDRRWYEVLDDGAWHEHAWRDPWVVADPVTGEWHMLLTARAAPVGEDDDPRDRGVIAHAVSSDLREWEVRAPVTDPGAGFAHLEVPQWVVVDGRPVVLFSCDTAHLAGARAAAGPGGGVWAVPAGGPGDPVDVMAATRLTDDGLYAGRAVQDRDGRWMLLGFENVGRAGEFVGRLSDPLPLTWQTDRLRVGANEEVR